MRGAAPEAGLEVIGDLAMQVAVARPEVRIEIDELQRAVASCLNCRERALDALAQRRFVATTPRELEPGARPEVEQNTVDVLQLAATTQRNLERDQCSAIRKSRSSCGGSEAGQHQAGGDYAPSGTARMGRGA